MIQLKYKPRIAIDARPLSYGLTGNSRYLFEVLKCLVHEKSYFEFYLYSNKEIHPMFIDFIKEKKLNTVVFKLNGFLWLNFYLPFITRKDRIDILWGTLQLLPFMYYSIPSVVNYHDLNFISAPETMTKANFYQHKFFSPLTISKAKSIFCLSENTRKEIANFKPESNKKLKLVYPGVIKKEIIDIDLKFTDSFILTVGTLEPRKNLQTIVEAYLLLKKENPDFPFKLILASRIGWGQEELTQKLKSGFYNELGIFLFENPDDNTLHTLYKKAAYFVFPSIHEGFGLPLLEAMVEQKICIASDIPVFKEILESGTDFLVSPLDSIGWKDAMLKVASIKNLKRKKYWDEKNWSWMKTASSIEETFLLLWHKKIELDKNAI